MNLNLLASELAKIYKGGNAAPTEMEIQEMRNSIIFDYSPKQLKVVFDLTVKLLSSRLTSLEREYTNVIGQPPDTETVDSTKLDELEKAGVDVSSIRKSNTGERASDWEYIPNQ